MRSSGDNELKTESAQPDLTAKKVGFFWLAVKLSDEAKPVETKNKQVEKRVNNPLKGRIINNFLFKQDLSIIR